MADSSLSSSLRSCLARAKHGDESARNRLFAACRSYLGLMARTNLQPWMRGKVDASDIVQQTLMDAHRDFDRFRGQSYQEWLAWLRQILNHNACDAARHYGAAGKRAVRREIPLNRDAGDDSQLPRFELPSPEDSPSQIAIHNERELLLAEAIDKLAADHREVIILRNIQRLSFAEVAEQLGRTRPAAQMLWMRAIQHLKLLLSSAESSESASGANG